jgi:hypothetical protein
MVALPGTLAPSSGESRVIWGPLPAAPLLEPLLLPLPDAPELDPLPLLEPLPLLLLPAPPLLLPLPVPPAQRAAFGVPSPVGPS